MTLQHRTTRAPATITVDSTETFRSGNGARIKSLEAARRLVGLPQRALSVLFPHQGPPPPITILPGHAARLTITVRAPGRTALYLYPEATSIMGGTDMVPDAPQSLLLDANGHATTQVIATPSDDRTTGQAALRLVAVDPAAPDEIAGEISGVMLAQEGTGSLVRDLLVMLILIGLAAQIWAPEWPILSIMIVVALGFILINAPPITNARFEPRRLLKPGQLIRSVALMLAGVAVWGIAMGTNIWSETAMTLCDTPMTKSCGWTDAVFDNATSVVASLGFAFLMLAAWAPAIRPAYLVGQLALFAGLLPLLVYDLTLVPAYLSEDGRDTFWILTETLLTSYPAMGWMLSGLGIGIVLLRQGLGTRGQQMAAFAVGGIGMIVMAVFGTLALILPAQEALYLNEAVTRRAYGVLLMALVVWLLIRPILSPLPRRKRVLRYGLGAAGVLICFMVLSFGAMSFVTLSEGLGTSNVPAVDFLFMAVLVQVLLIAAALSEVLLWQRRRARAKARRTAPPPQTPPISADAS